MFNSNINNIYILISTAASVGIIHTILGPDHYLPFISLSISEKWSLRKTVLVTILSGLGHTLMSVLIGSAGFFIGASVQSIESIDAVRGDIAAWLLISFGFLYLIWGLKKSFTGTVHLHSHVHPDGTIHSHNHHHNETIHKHVHIKNKNKISPWVLFIFFVLGPCEALIPLIAYPAIHHNYTAVIIISLVFSLATISIMLLLVFLGYKGIQKLPFQKYEKYSHAIAGLIIFLAGLGIIMGL
ncbi:MAG: sulfite exporter TauE/SafE family protein [Spirochaetia bacterium]|nr:sulfite exporter TauE/SafE family protein [Spirochaetia bacterium]